MKAEQVITHPSMQREFKRFRSLGGMVRVKGQRVTLVSNIVPDDVVLTFLDRIKRYDPDDTLEISITWMR